VGVVRVALVLEYDGTRYSGFQYQANAPSVQGEIEDALMRFTGHWTRVRSASRTDAGVHARGQVVTCDTVAAYPPEVFRRALNAALPADIAVREAYRVKEKFDPRRHALHRFYRYTILNQRNPSPLTRHLVYHVPGPLDAVAMERAAQSLVGRHDFRAFSGPISGNGGTVREVFHAGVQREGDLLYLDMVANSFLPHQVRRTGGALVRVGRGVLAEEEFKAFIDLKSSKDAGPALPSHGLCLVKVTYADFPPKDEIDAKNI